uniref:Uncharacterized protein n=1 Tax=Arundo donax TaxID=35708 RepID=A0A0A9D066_ARUDO
MMWEESIKRDLKDWNITKELSNVFKATSRS